MSKTYTLNATALYAGMYRGWTSGYWSNLYPAGDSKNVGTFYYRTDTGAANDGMYATSIFFDASKLTALRTKRILSITLSLYVSERPSPTTELYPISFKLDNSTTNWQRSDLSQTAAGTDVLAYIRRENSGDPSSSGTVTLDMGTIVPKYGYVAGPVRTGAERYITIYGTPVLTVVTDETDIWLNNGGTWVQGYPWVNDGGTWKQGSRVWVNNNGTWVSTS